MEEGLVDTAPADLVRRIGAGDKNAEEQLVKRYQRPIFEILKNRTRDSELAKDLLQETLIIVLQRLRTRGIEQPDKLVAFMHRTAHNLVIGYFRKENRRNTHADTDLVEVQQDRSAADLDLFLREEQAQLVRGLLDELRTPRDREILLRFYVWNQEKPIICDAMDLDGGQFDRVISRARQRFGDLFTKRLAERPVVSSSG